MARVPFYALQPTALCACGAKLLSQRGSKKLSNISTSININIISNNSSRSSKFTNNSKSSHTESPRGLTTSATTSTSRLASFWTGVESDALPMTSFPFTAIEDCSDAGESGRSNAQWGIG
eukprot:2624641-Amphidinium_carterae.2